MIHTTLTSPRPGAVIVPAGSAVTSSTPSVDGSSIGVDLADYDYAPFADSDAPAFEFIADVVCVAGDGSTSIDRGITCISSPGRTSREKE